MKFTAHNFIKEGKSIHCTTCKQTWSSYPKTDCPGVPVIEYDSKAATLLTLHQLEKAHLHPVDVETPDAAYRTRHHPYFQPLYDQTKALPWAEDDLAAEQQAIDEKHRRQEENRMKYTCRICGEYKAYPAGYGMRDRVCAECQRHAVAWNEQIALSRKLAQPDTVIVNVVGDFEGWPFNTVSITGYSVLDLLSGELLRHTEQVTPDDRDYLVELLSRNQGYTIRMQYGAIQFVEKAWNVFIIADKKRHVVVHDLVKECPGEHGLPKSVASLETFSLVDLCAQFGIQTDEQAPDIERLRALLLHIAQLQPVHFFPEA